MDFFKTSDSRFRTPMFNECVKSAFNKQTNMPSVTDCVVLDIRRGMEQLQNTKFFQPPPFLVGGFVGSKICEHKNGSINYSNLLGQIIHTVTSFTPIVTQSKSFGEENWRKKPDSFTKSYAKVAAQSKCDTPPPSVVISPAQVTQQTVLPVVSSPTTMPSQQENKLSPLSSVSCPLVFRTVSESSETSWASVDPAEERDVLFSNPWLSNIVVCVGDNDNADDSDSDWDCVEDFQSENGEVISDFKWNGDSLSPISSPVSRTPPTPAAALDDYDSDESDGVLISCGHGYVVDDEEEAKERRLSEERIQDANRRWDQNLLTTTDETDGICKKSTQSKTVN